MIENASIVWWLRLVALFVVATLVVGGGTRLTDSGLSITEWEPILGAIPPLSHAEWMRAFELYKEIPEYELVNKGMTLAEFEVIYLWEWAHRLVARSIGLVFFVPFVVFWVRGMLPRWFRPWGVLLLALGGLQGAVGWWMVTSGLTERVDVSQYRLATHMTLACIILALTVWLSERVAGRRGIVPVPAGLRAVLAVMPFLILVQIAMGALVAGIDAGLASNTWPLMGGAWVPPGLDLLSPAWLNAFENPLAVQFNHRIAGYVVLMVALLAAVLAWRAGAMRRLATGLALLVTAQAVVGILVVVGGVPLVLAGLHQLVAAVLLWVAVVAATRAAPEAAEPAGAQAMRRA